MLQLTTDLGGWNLPLPVPDGEDVDSPTPERALHLGLTPGLPILLHEDGTYDEELNRWLHTLPTVGCTSPHTWAAYARDVAMWVRFLAHYRPKTSWMQARLQDFQAFRTARLRPNEGSAREPITAASWNRQVTALESLYGWALDAGLISKLPFKHKMRVGPRGFTFGPTKSNTLKSNHYREEKTPRPLYVRYDRFYHFREAGLRWVGEDGEEDRPNAARHAHRNVVLADLLYMTGLRIQEGGSLLEWDIPTAATLNTLRTTGATAFTVAEGIAKGGKRRTITVGLLALRQVRNYVAVERENLLDRFTKSDGSYTLIPDPLFVRRVDEGHYGILATGRVRSISRATPAERARMVEVGPDGRQRPVALWIGDRGRPMRLKTWEDVFEDAEGRSGVYVRPHMLRHTYAVNLLSRLVGATVRAVKEDEATDHGKVIRRLYSEPLNEVRKQLGHASITQTYAYLDCLEEAQLYLNAAVAEMDELLADIPVEAIRAHG